MSLKAPPIRSQYLYLRAGLLAAAVVADHELAPGFESLEQVLVELLPLLVLEVHDRVAAETQTRFYRAVNEVSRKSNSRMMKLGSYVDRENVKKCLCKSQISE